MAQARQTDAEPGPDDDGASLPARVTTRGYRVGRLLEMAARPFTLLALLLVLIVPTALAERRERIEEQRRTLIDPLRDNLERLPVSWNTQSAATRGALAAPSMVPAYAELYARSTAVESELVASLLKLSREAPALHASIEEIARVRATWRQRPNRFFAGALSADDYRDALPQQDELRSVVEREWRRALDVVNQVSAERQAEAARLDTAQALATTLLSIAALLAALLIIWLDARSRRLSVVEDARQRAQVAAEQRALVLAQVSHDLKSPLSAISVTSQTLHARAARAGDDTLLRGLSRIEGAAARMEGMVTDLLDAARSEAGESPRFFREPVALRPLVERVTEELGGARESARVVVEVPERLPAVLANAPKVERVVQNLVDNALKFSPEGGVVRVHARRDGGSVRLDVSDQGPGLPESAARRVFEPFWQEPPGRRREGSGLGLAIAKSIVEAHGGHIWVERTDGQGSTFAFTLPIAEAAATAGGTSRASHEEGR